ncbi:MAG: hypothetical protein AB7N76_13050 [Planctomycetota bacterium]
MIDVQCTCGRTYRVPDERAGRKLQCKRCGTVSRVPVAGLGSEDDGVLVPFRMVDDEEPAPAPELALAAPTRRCPSCGFTDDATVVVCVRCGFDWRSGKRLADAHDAAEESARLQVLRDAASLVQALDAQGNLALTPAGLVLGPYVLLRSAAVPTGELARGVVARLGRARWKALAGFGLWVAVVVMGLALLDRRRHAHAEHLSVRCTNRLELLGRVLQQQLADRGSFPAAQEGHLRRALEGLAEHDPSFSGEDLRCPLSDSLSSYRCREQEQLTQGVSPDYLLLWDPLAHAEPEGEPVFRALRFDGTIERFPSEEALAAGTTRGRFAHLQGETPGEPAPSRSGPSGEGSDPPRPSGNAQIDRFVAFADECDRRDPVLEAGLEVEDVVFSERTGVPARDFLPLLLDAKDGAVRRRAARMVARAELSKGQRRTLAQKMAKDADPVLRFAAAHVFRDLGEPWLADMVWVVEASQDAVREAAQRLIGREALASAAGAEAVLRAAAKLRERQGAQGDDAVLPLPAAALIHVARFLGHKELGREAAASFYSAKKDGLEPLEGALKNLDPQVRAAALRVAMRFVQDHVLPLETYLARVESEGDASLQADALRPFVEERDSPTAALTAWVLAFLRRAPQEPAQGTARELLARVGVPPLAQQQPPGTLEQLVAGLADEGDRGALLSELASATRLRDQTLDGLVRKLWRKVTDPAVRVRLVDILEKRPYEGAMRTLLEAAEDDDEEVRTQALQGLLRGLGQRTDAYRRDAARALAKRLKDEKGVRARKLLFELAVGEHVCGRYPPPEKPARHACSAPFLAALKAQARDGDRTALRCLAGHPSEQALDALIELIGATPDGPYRNEVYQELSNMTGLAARTVDAKGWRKEVKAKHDQILRRFEQRAETERSALLSRNQRAVRRAEDLAR